MDSDLRQRIRARQPVLGTFVKTGASAVAEVLGTTGLDFIVADAEHAPLGFAALDGLVLGARAAGLPCLVRVPALHPGLAGQLLDLGAAGIVCPHVTDAATAEMAVAETKYSGGWRGYSPSTRAAVYGTGDVAGYAARADDATILVCQMEDRAALDRLDEIAAVDAVDCLLIGRADLAQSLGVGSVDNPAVADAVRMIAEAGQRHGRATGIYVGRIEEAADYLPLGITLFLCGSDQSLLAAATRSAVAAFSAMTI